MNFLAAQGLTTTINDPNEFDRALDNALSPGKIGMQRLTHAMKMQFPDTNLVVTDPAEREQRKDRSQRMLTTMNSFLRGAFEARQSRAKLRLPPFKPQLPRALWETVLNLPHKEQNEEYVRRYNILLSGTPEEKTALVMEQFDAFKRKMADKGWTRERLLHMTNDEIIANFEDLEMLKAWHGAMENLPKRETGLALSDEQEKSMEDFETEFDVGPYVFTKVDLIASPCYGMVRTERIPGFEADSINYHSLTHFRNPTDEEPENEDAEPEIGEDGIPVYPKSNQELAEDALHDMFGAVMVQRHQMLSAMRTEVERQLDGVSPADVLWLDEKGNRLQPETEKVRYRTDSSAPPRRGLIVGEKLTAILPDGTKKVFSAKMRDDGSTEFHADVPQMAADAIPAADESLPPEQQLNQTLPQTLDALFKVMDDTDPWYISSSSQFKTLKETLKKARKEWQPITDLSDAEQVKRISRLNDQMKDMVSAANSYLASKKDKTDFNDLEQNRFAAVSKILTVLQPQAEKCKSLAHLQLFADRYHHLEKTVGIDCPYSEEGGYVLRELQQNILENSAKHLCQAPRKAVLTEADQASLKRRMAELTLFHLIVTERGSDFNGTAGPLEKALIKKGPDALIDSINKQPEFDRLIGKITPLSVDKFIMEDGARTVAKQLVASSLNKQKQAAAPEHVAQKDMSQPQL